MLVPDDLDNNLVLNKHRLTTFESALKEVEDILAARTGAKMWPPTIKTLRKIDDQMDVDIVTEGKKSKEKGERIPSKDHCK